MLLLPQFRFYENLVAHSLLLPPHPLIHLHLRPQAGCIPCFIIGIPHSPSNVILSVFSFFSCHTHLAKLHPSEKHLRTCFSIPEGRCRKFMQQFKWMRLANCNENQWTSTPNVILLCLEKTLSPTHLNFVSILPIPLISQVILPHMYWQIKDTNYNFSIFPSPNLWSWFHRYSSFSSSFISSYPLSFESSKILFKL